MSQPPGPNFDYGRIPIGYYDRMLREGGGIRRLWHTLKFERVLDYLPESDGGSLLDIGCFAGSFLSMVPRHRFERQLGIDILPEQIKYATHHYGTPFRSFRVAPSITSFGDVGEPFDAVTLIEVIEHLRHDEIVGLFEQLDATLAPGGRLIVTTPNYASSWPVLEAILNRVGDVSYDEQHITRFNYFSFEKKLAEIWTPLLHEYDVELKTTTHFLSPFLASLSYEIARGLARAVPHQSWTSPIGNLVLTVLRKRQTKR
ncbi:MAG: class I SAM-dependent methyltransferase [Labilithrix sp.]|nr:class I SAM-dependent methyltransferase [Labilithrix sp.]